MMKEKLSNWAMRLSKMADTASNQTPISNLSRPQQFLIGIVKRQAVLLADISTLLANNSMAHQQSTLILCRCIVDDFLLILYLHSKEFAEQEFINHTAKTRNEQLKERRISRAINNKYFQGKNEGMFTNESVREGEDLFFNNPRNHVYLSNIKKRKFIDAFPSTKNIVESLPMNPIFKANAHQLFTWKYLSSYVHYSILTFEKETMEGVRESDMEHVHSVIYAAHNTLILTTTALREKFSLPIPLPDPTSVSDEITEGFQNISE